LGVVQLLVELGEKIILAREGFRHVSPTKREKRINASGGKRRASTNPLVEREHESSRARGRRAPGGRAGRGLVARAHTDGSSDRRPRDHPARLSRQGRLRHAPHRRACDDGSEYGNAHFAPAAAAAAHLRTTALRHAAQLGARNCSGTRWRRKRRCAPGARLRACTWYVVSGPLPHLPNFNCLNRSNQHQDVEKQAIADPDQQDGFHTHKDERGTSPAETTREQ
jgi:hypothetical protein